MSDEGGGAGRFDHTLVSLRPPTAADGPLLRAGRDAEFHRFLGEGSADPQPTFCIVVAGEVVGWVDFDTDRAWLRPGEVNIGYNVFAAHRGRGIATRAVRLLLDHLAEHTVHRVATLVINPDNVRSLGVAARLGCVRRPDLDGNAWFSLELGTAGDEALRPAPDGDRPR